MNGAIFQPVVHSFRAFAQKLDDALNPIAVKELRQAVQAKYVSGVLLLLLMGQLVAMAAVVLGKGTHDLDIGRQAFLVLFGILVFSCMVFLPLYVAGRLFAERVAADTDLLSITALRPRAIVWGTFSTGLLLTALIYAASAPFLAFTLLLRGIDRSSVFALLLVGFVGTAFLIQLSVFLACLPLPRLLRPLLGAVAIGAGFFGFVLAIALAVAHFEDELLASADDFWRVLASFLVLGTLATGFFFILSVAVVSPRSANRALPLRAYITIAWALSFGVVAVCSAADESMDPVHTWMIVFVSLLGLGLVVALCERDEYGPRIARTIPRRGLLRGAAFLFYSGAAGGVAWSCLLIGLTLAAGALWDAYVASVWRVSSRSYYYYYYHHDYGELGLLAILGGCSLFLFCYCMTASLIRRRFLPKTPQAYTLFIAVVVATITFVPALIGAGVFYESYPRHTSLGLWYVTTPIALTDHYCEDHGATGLLFASVWAAFVARLNLPWFCERFRAFRRVEDTHASPSQALSNE